MTNPTVRLAMRDFARLAATDPSAAADILDALELDLEEAAGPYADAARQLLHGLYEGDRAYAEAVDRHGRWDWQRRCEPEPELPFDVPVREAA